MSVLERLRELEAAATNPPWTSYKSGDASYLDAVFPDGTTRGLLAGIHAKEWPDDAALIAESRNALPALLAIVEAAYIAKHEGRFEPLHDALYKLESTSLAPPKAEA